MKRIITILMLFPFLAIGQTKFSQLPASAPDVNTSFVGLKNVSGVYTDYLFTFNSLNVPLADTSAVLRGLIQNSPVIAGSGDILAAGSAVNLIIYLVPATKTFLVNGYLTLNSISAGNVQLQIDWTDENNTSRVYFTSVITSPSYTNIPPLTIRAKAGTYIVVATSTTIGITINYDCGARIIQQ